VSRRSLKDYSVPTSYSNKPSNLAKVAFLSARMTVTYSRPGFER
jgi:hypothetical protein